MNVKKLTTRLQQHLLASSFECFSRRKVSGQNLWPAGLPASLEEAILELADACRRDSSALCLASEELEEIIGLAVESVRDPSGPSCQRIQALIDKEYDQFVASLPVAEPKASPTASEHRGACSKGRRGRPRGARRTTEVIRPLSRRQQRRRLYGIIQELYKKNRTRCAKTVLSGDWAKERQTTSLEEQESYWKQLFEQPSKADSRDVRKMSRALFEISQPVTTTEYGLVLKSTHESSPSLDYVDRRVLRGIEPRTGAAHMNLWLLACRPPEAFKVGVTVSLPKSADAADPSEYRPMICRLFHRLLAHRAGRHLPLGARQKAFRQGDGLADYVWILLSLIEDCKARHRPLCVTFVDVRKAFDTVSYESVVKACPSA